MMEGVNLRFFVSTFVNVTMYPQYDNNMIIKQDQKPYVKLKSLFSYIPIQQPSQETACVTLASFMT
jgi:hypothetical protein